MFEHIEVTTNTLNADVSLAVIACDRRLRQIEVELHDRRRHTNGDLTMMLVGDDDPASPSSPDLVWHKWKEVAVGSETVLQAFRIRHAWDEIPICPRTGQLDEEVDVLVSEALEIQGVRDALLCSIRDTEVSLLRASLVLGVTDTEEDAPAGGGDGHPRQGDLFPGF